MIVEVAVKVSKRIHSIIIKIDTDISLEGDIPDDIEILFRRF